MNSKKRFTFVEFVLVIALITIATVLAVSAYGTTKKNTKMTGVDANLRTVSAYAQKEIGNYKANQADLFEKELANAFGAEDIKNPFTDATGTTEYSSVGSNGTAVAYSTTDNDASTATTNWENDTAKTQLRGSVLVCAVPDPDGTNNLTIGLYPFDQNGKIIISKKVIIEP